MKTSNPLILSFLIVLLAITVSAQESCKVLLPSISGTYEGKCKKGLANGKGIASGTDRYEGQFKAGLPDGKGTYTWSNGDVYTGEWQAGMRFGIGKLSMKVNGEEIIQDGLWEKNTYKGPKPKAPSVTFKTGVDRYDFRKDITDKNRVLISFMQNGMRNNSVMNLLMSSSSGYETQLTEMVGYDEVTYPVTIKVAYTTYNKLRTVTVEVRFEFVIYEPGDWKVEINN
jgi:hypothetical protein